MQVEELKCKISKINIWKRGEQKAPHKPLLILLALGKLLQGQTEIAYEEIREEMIELLIEYGHSNGRVRPDHPFVRLKNDGIWKLSENIKNDKYSEQLLLLNNVKGQFTQDVLELLRHNNRLIHSIIEQVLSEHFESEDQQRLREKIGYIVHNTQ